MYYLLDEEGTLLDVFESKEDGEAWIVKEGLELDLTPDMIVDPSIDIFERRIILKKRYKTRPEIDIYTNTSVRNEVVFFVDSKGKVDKSELDDFIKTKLATKRGKPIHRSWIHKFARYFKVDKRGKNYTFQLSSLGKELVKKLKAEGYPRM